MPDTTDFEGINIMIRRKGLGLSQAELADMLDTSQITISRWETGARTPHDPLTIHILFDEYEERFLDLVDELVSVAEDEEKLANAPEVAYPMYRTQAEYAERCPHAKRLPYLGMYQMAVAQAAMLVRSDGQAPYFEYI